MKQSSFLIVSLFSCAICFAQERAQADVSITSVTLKDAASNTAIISNQPSTNITAGPGSQRTKVAKTEPLSQELKCSITVHSYHDDDAYPTTLIVLLPVEVTVSSYPANATLHKSSSNSTFVGYISFDLGQMSVGQNITVEFTFAKSKYGNKVGAYAYSGTPDPNPTNNYKEASY